ncbi:MAG: hypothetical protein U0840_14780 [Gemmataceae bacterium]
MRTLIWVVMFLCGLSSSVTAASFPGGILDSTGRTAYLVSEGGIDAVDLLRGERLWKSREAQLPLLVAADRLYALGFFQGPRFSVVAFDLASKAERVFRTEVTDLPRWVNTRGGAGQSFHCRWEQSGRFLLLDWEARADAGTGPSKQVAGQVRINLETGRVETVPVAIKAPRPTDPLPRQLEKKAIRWQGRAGGQILAVVAEELPESTLTRRQERLVLRAWDARTGREAPARELMRGGRPTVLLDLDGKHLWLRDALSGEDVFTPGPWSVVSVLDGHLVARVPFLAGTQVATLIGSRAYLLSASVEKKAFGQKPPGRQVDLHALDLDAGGLVWKHHLGALGSEQSRAASGAPAR